MAAAKDENDADGDAEADEGEKRPKHSAVRCPARSPALHPSFFVWCLFVSAFFLPLSSHACLETKDSLHSKPVLI